MRLLTAVALTAAALVAPAAATAAPPNPSSVATSVSTESVTPTSSGWAPRPEEYASTVVETDLQIPTSDGTVLLADLKRPVDADGQVVDTPLPVVVTITAYSKTVIGSPSGATLGGSPPDFLVQRGYLQLTVDARGTGGSGGTWQVFGEREQLDSKEIVEWAAQQSWSDGSVAMSGPSYMGISQLFAAGLKPQGLKAIFPQVPTAEVYRDIVASGGQLDTGFMPLWLGLVNLTGLVPSTSPQAVENLLTHLVGNGASSIQLLLEAALGGPQAYDGEFYESRSTITNSVPNIDVPTFLIGGEYDLFQRGTPLVYQALRERGVPVKMILGPWDHLQGSNGQGVPDAGLGTLGELQLRWFDHYVKGLPDPALDSDLPSFSYYELGSGEWQYRDSYLSDQSAASFKLSGSSATLGGAPGQLTQGQGFSQPTAHQPFDPVQLTQGLALRRRFDAQVRAVLDLGRMRQQKQRQALLQVSQPVPMQRLVGTGAQLRQQIIDQAQPAPGLPGVETVGGGQGKVGGQTALIHQPRLHQPQQAARHLEQQLLAAAVPDQPRLALGRQHRDLPGLQRQLQAIALKTGAPAQRHLHQHEVGKGPRPHFDLGAIAQHKELATPHFGAKERSVDTAVAPAQVVFHQLTGQQSVAFLA